MTVDIRVTRPDEWRAAADTFRAALLHPPSADKEWERDDIVDSWRESHSLTAWDGARCVGHAGAFHVATMVPGGATLDTAAVTRVGVSQTHTRQGILTRMMTQLLRDALDQGKPLASLRASEAVIYGRFGYAVAGEAAEAEIDVSRGVGIVGPVAAGSMRILSAGEILDVVRPLHARVGLDRPGALVRPDWMTRRYLHDAISGEKAQHVAVHTAPDGTDDGYVHYDLEWEETFGQSPRATATVHDLFGASPAVELALWRFVLSLDLISRVRAYERPLDDAIRWSIDDVRRYRIVATFDEQWLRLLDVDVALSSRTYNPVTGAVTIAVTDPLFAANTATWRVDASGVEKVADTARDDADITAPISGLSATYFGGTSWWATAAAGRAQERRPGALALADGLFQSTPQPRCGSFF